MDTEKVIELLDMQPNNWYINREKLDCIRRVWEEGLQDNLPPVLVSYIDGKAALIDGHSRAYAAFEQGETKIRALIENLEDIEGSSELYKHIHIQGPQKGITSIADLANRILEPDDYKQKWIGYCANWFKINDKSG